MAASPPSRVRRVRRGRAATAVLPLFAGRVTSSRARSRKKCLPPSTGCPRLLTSLGPKGDDLNKQIQAGKYPGIVKTRLDGFDQLAYLEGTSEHSARDVFFYFSGTTPSAVRYKNWKMYYSMAPGGASGWFLPLVNYHWTLVGNVKRDPFEQTISFGDAKSAMALGGSLASPSTAYLYDWNMFPS